ncbi:hypothetical protein M378DRAFT_164681 [Amanita muscaria Koide BX008]|uniref:Uncharacterized protein n=1 Tax=Amanita muscaria (strain Koide BX008) TaxID=946122 RepID=A0A0C2WP14_AMAMK|nr:hypothetical protein M378DRAFT_164681 [Amanita muscaria Koide BX008]
MSYTVLGGSPFSFSTSSSILLERYSGSPDEMCAPSWTGQPHERLEFVQSQDELSAFLRELGKIGTTQVRAFVTEILQEVLPNARTVCYDICWLRSPTTCKL